MNLGSANVSILRDGRTVSERHYDGVQIDHEGNLTVGDTILEPGEWMIVDRYNPFDPKNEVRIKLGDSKVIVAVESAEANPNGTSYVRYIINDHEVLYWNVDEWEEDGENVMGAIFGYMFSVLGNRALSF